MNRELLEIVELFRRANYLENEHRKTKLEIAKRLDKLNQDEKLELVRVLLKEGLIT